MAQHNLRTVVSFEVGRTLSKKRFWIIALLVPVALAVVFALAGVSGSASGGASEPDDSAEITFTYSDASGYVDPAIAESFGGTAVTDDSAAISAVREGTSDAHFVYPADPLTETTEVYGEDLGLLDNGQYGAVASALLSASAQQTIGDDALAFLAQGDIDVTSTVYKDGDVAAGFGGVVPPLLFVVVFFLVIMMLSNQMLNSTLEEKENRVMEMILTTVNPTVLILGKIVALFFIGLVQMLVFVVPVIIGYVFFRDSLSLPEIDLSTFSFEPGQMVVGALLLIGGFALFTGSLVAVGAIMPTAKDAGGLFTTLILLIIVPFYAVSQIITEPSSLIVQVLTYFPYSAPITAMLRNGFGVLAPWEATIVIAELFLLSYAVLLLAVRLFRYGSIEYSSRVSLKNVFPRRKAKRA
ncbi:MAG: sodium transporter [Glaciihabitans sp.]|nr:sodium transporter [Glaciihabitans sp.]